MKRWALIVAILYASMLAILSLPVTLLAFAPTIELKDGVQTFGQWQWWLWLVVMGLAQAALLAVPVRIATRRTVTRRPLVLTVLAASLMMAGLVVGAVCCIFEIVFRDKTLDMSGLLPLALAAVAWFAWALVFFRMSRNAEPDHFVSRLCNWMLKGSILELLIAVPTHIVARSRDYCCAGVMTFVGLTLGISVMLFSFGPGVLFLFIARWRRLHPSLEASAAS